jgi:hypothetical protein
VGSAARPTPGILAALTVKAGAASPSPGMIGGMNPAGPPLDLLEVQRLVRAFEDDTVALESFHHRQHLTVAAHLAMTWPPDEALDRMRRGLLALLARHGKDGYHETVTAFWMRAIHHRLGAQPHGWAVDQRLGDVIGWAEATRPLDAHYSKARLAEDAARHTFLAPDLAPIPSPG